MDLKNNIENGLLNSSSRKTKGTTNLEHVYQAKNGTNFRKE